MINDWQHIMRRVIAWGRTTELIDVSPYVFFYPVEKDTAKGGQTLSASRKSSMSNVPSLTWPPV